MTPIPFATILEGTLSTLQQIEDELLRVSEAATTERVHLLVTTFLDQHRGLLDTVQRIEDKQSSRALKRMLANPPSSTELAPLPASSDSRTVTAWLLQALRTLVDHYASLRRQPRLGPTARAIAELHNLFVAFSKRIAMEAHRFEDL